MPVIVLGSTAIEFFFYMDTNDHAIYRVWIHLFFLPSMPEEKNHSDFSWNQTQVLLLHKRLLKPIEHAASAQV